MSNSYNPYLNPADIFKFDSAKVPVGRRVTKLKTSPSGKRCHCGALLRVICTKDRKFFSVCSSSRVGPKNCLNNSYSASMRRTIEKNPGPCFNCKSKDHKVAACPKPVICRNCKKTGHIKKDCKVNLDNAPSQELKKENKNSAQVFGDLSNWEFGYGSLHAPFYGKLFNNLTILLLILSLVSHFYIELFLTSIVFSVLTCCCGIYSIVRKETFLPKFFFSYVDDVVMPEVDEDQRTLSHSHGECKYKDPKMALISVITREKFFDFVYISHEDELIISWEALTQFLSSEKIVLTDSFENNKARIERCMKNLCGVNFPRYFILERGQDVLGNTALVALHYLQFRKETMQHLLPHSN